MYAAVSCGVRNASAAAPRSFAASAYWAARRSLRPWARESSALVGAIVISTRKIANVVCTLSVLCSMRVVARGRLRQPALEDVHVGADLRVFPEGLEHVVGDADAAVGDVLAEGVDVVGAVDHDAVAEREGVLVEVAFDEALRRVGRRHALAGLDEGPVGLAPDRIFDLALDFEVAARGVELPLVVAVVEGLAAAGRRDRLPDELAVAEEVDGVRREVDCDDRAGARRVIRKTFGLLLRGIVAVAELPPVTWLLLRLRLLCEDLRDCHRSEERRVGKECRS